MAHCRESLTVIITRTPSMCLCTIPIKAFRKIEIKTPYYALTNGGHITYVELDGDTAKNLSAFERIITCTTRALAYGSVNHPIDRDPIYGMSASLATHVLAVEGMKSKVCRLKS